MSKKVYWDKFYKKHNTRPFEWLVEYKDLETSLSYSRQKNSLTILFDAGCGTSLFGLNLKSSLLSPALLISGDFSHEALALLRTKHETSEKYSASLTDYVQCDCKNLPFREELFDFIIDKGYLDSVLKSRNTEKATSDALDSMRSLVDKLDRKSGGFMIQVTDEAPELRINLFDQLGGSNFSYSFKDIDLGNEKFYFCYFLLKK